MQWLNLTIFIVFVVALGALAFDAVRLRLLNKKLFAQATQAELDKGIIADKLNKIILEHSAEKTDGFLRFVSDSREQAYKYIEEVQEAINAFDEEVGPIVKHYKETGKVLNRKHSDTVKRIVDAYEIIMTLMPEDEGDKSV